MKEQHSSSARRFIGLASDQKPMPGQMGPDGKTYTAADVPEGSEFVVVDTGLKFVWYEKRWHPDKHPLTALLQQVLAEGKKQTALLTELKEKIK